MKKQLISVLIAIAFLANCGGLAKKLAPVAPVSPYDSEKTCQELESELKDADATCKGFASAVRGRNVGNAIFVVGGLLLVWPMLFLIDVSSKDDINYANSVGHYNYLLELCNKKGCDTEDLTPIVMPPTPVIEASTDEHGYKPGTQ